MDDLSIDTIITPKGIKLYYENGMPYLYYIGGFFNTRANLCQTIVLPKVCLEILNLKRAENQILSNEGKLEYILSLGTIPDKGNIIFPMSTNTKAITKEC